MTPEEVVKEIAKHSEILNGYMGIIKQLESLVVKSIDYNENVSLAAASQVTTGLMALAAVHYEKIFDAIKKGGVPPL